MKFSRSRAVRESDDMELEDSVRALEFYSGIGGLHLALQRSAVRGRIVRAFDWDQTACQVYATNRGPGVVQKVDISTLTATQVAAYRASLWLLSPSCQPYTVLCPSPKGALDPRAQSFLHLVQNVLPKLASHYPDALPTHLLVENVAGFETSTTRRLLLDTLHGLGYSTSEHLLTPLQFGIPNSRLRYYLLAKLAPLSFRVSAGDVLRHMPGHGQPWIDPRSGSRDVESVNTPVESLRTYLDLDPEEGSSRHPHAVPDKVLEKWGRLFDIVGPGARRTCCFTRGYTQLVERAGSILQVNEELDTTMTFDTFLAAQQAHDPDAVRILYPLKLRYFSPAELLRLFCFESTGRSGVGSNPLYWPEGVSTKSKYRLIGNSVNVRVVTELINYLFET